MEDLGARSSYLMLERGAPVLFADGEELGAVSRVIDEPDADIFEGLEVREKGLAGRDLFVPAERIDEIYERGVMLDVGSDQRDSIPEARS